MNCTIGFLHSNRYTYLQVTCPYFILVKMVRDKKIKKIILIWLILKRVRNVLKAFSKYVCRVKFKKWLFLSLKTSTIKKKKKNVIKYVFMLISFSKIQKAYMQRTKIHTALHPENDVPALCQSLRLQVPLPNTTIIRGRVPTAWSSSNAGRGFQRIPRVATDVGAWKHCELFYGPRYIIV